MNLNLILMLNNNLLISFFIEVIFYFYIFFINWVVKINRIKIAELDD